jgi:hypothetical protein
MKYSSGKLRGMLGLILVTMVHSLIADETAGKAARERLEKELEAAEERSADERIDVMAIDVIRQFGHEIRFDEPLVNLSMGSTGDAAGERFTYTFVKFGIALFEQGLLFDDLRYFPLPKDARVTVTDAGVTVRIHGKEATAEKLPESMREELVSEGDRATLEDGLVVEVVSSVDYGFSGEQFGKDRWIGSFGIVPVRIWDGEVYLGRKHLGSVKDLAKENRIRLDPLAGTVAS